MVLKRQTPSAIHAGCRHLAWYTKSSAQTDINVYRHLHSLNVLIVAIEVRVYSRRLIQKSFSFWSAVRVVLTYSFQSSNNRAEVFNPIRFNAHTHIHIMQKRSQSLTFFGEQDYLTTYWVADHATLIIIHIAPHTDTESSYRLYQ